MGFWYGNKTSYDDRTLLVEQLSSTNALHYLSYFSSYGPSKSGNSVNLSFICIFKSTYLDRTCMHDNKISPSNRTVLGEQLCCTNALYYLSYFSSYGPSKSGNFVNSSFMCIFDSTYLDRNFMQDNEISPSNRTVLGEQLSGTNALYYLSYFSSYRASKSANSINFSFM